MREVAVHLGVEDDALGQIVEVDVLDDLQGGLRCPFGLGERLDRLRVAGVVVAQATAVGLQHVVFDVGVLLEGLVVGEGEVEVLDVVDVYLGHVATTTFKALIGVSCVFFLFFTLVSFLIVAFLVDALLSDVHEVDVLLTGVVMDGGGELGSFFVAVHGSKGVFQLDVGVVGVIKRCDLVLSIVDVHRDLEASVFEELAQFEVCCHVEGGMGFEGVVGDAAVQGTEAGRAI